MLQAALVSAVRSLLWRQPRPRQHAWLGHGRLCRPPLRDHAPVMKRLGLIGTTPRTCVCLAQVATLFPSCRSPDLAKIAAERSEMTCADRITTRKEEDAALRRPHPLRQGRARTAVRASPQTATLRPDTAPPDRRRRTGRTRTRVNIDVDDDIDGARVTAACSCSSSPLYWQSFSQEGPQSLFSCTIAAQHRHPRRPRRLPRSSLPPRKQQHRHQPQGERRHWQKTAWTASPRRTR